MKLISLLWGLIISLPLAGQSASELPPEEVAKLVPGKIKGFRSHDPFHSKRMTVGSITYSLCEKRFEGPGEKEIKILLFDFKNAPMMYTQAMRKWNSHELIDSDSVVLRLLQMDQCTGWESYHRQTNTSQIFLGICDRFFLSMTGERVSLDQLKEVAKTFPFDKFPR